MASTTNQPMGNNKQRSQDDVEKWCKLGALGCGAFCNPPSHIAKLFHEVFEEPEFKNKYRLISFAILDNHNSHRSHNPEGNYIPFEKEFSND